MNFLPVNDVFYAYYSVYSSEYLLDYSPLMNATVNPLIYVIPDLPKKWIFLAISAPVGYIWLRH